MSRPFIVVRFLANQSARWTSWYGMQASEHFLPTRPFLALPVTLKDIGKNYHPSYDPFERQHYLFIVSPCKPTGSDGDCLPLASSEGERIDLVVNPPFPLSFGRPLYLHAGICFEDNGFDLSSAGDPADVQYRLDEESFRLFCGAARASLQKRDDLLFLNKRRRRISGGDDPVEDSWDSWSGRSERGTLHDPKAFAFQRVPFAELNLPLEPPTIYNELRLFRQLTNDFSWAGVTPTVAWVERVMDNANKQDFFDVPVVRKEWLPLFELPRLSGDLLEATRAVHSMRIPYDGDPLPETDVVEDQFAWDDEPEPTFDYPPFVQPAVALGNVKIIVFDLYGTIFDRERVIRDVLESLAAPKAHRFTSDDLYRLYTTYESYRSREQSSTTDLIRGALNDVAEHLGLSLNNEAVAIALKQISQPPLYADVLPAIETLHSCGLKLLCISPIDHAFSEAIQSSLPCGMAIVPTTYVPSALHAPEPSHYSELLTYCGSIVPEIQADQVLLVSTARYRVLEPATAAHIPTALLHRQDCVEACVKWDDGQTAVINVDDLKSLCETVVPTQ